MTNYWGLYKPLFYEREPEYQVKLDQCRHHVHDDLGVGFHQCIRKPSVKVLGYKFCKTHSKIFRERNGIK